MIEEEFLIPDTRWNLWNCNSFQEFQERFLIKGKFHKDVPEDILKSYQIVEKMMAYSYYCYEIYDEAFSKLTRIFEMAVKQKANQLQIEYPRKKFISLHQRIKDLAAKTHPELENEWINAKEIRNLFNHQDGHFVGGPIGKENAFHHYINIINRIFKDGMFIEEIKKSQLDFRIKTERFSKGLYVLNTDKRYLVGSAVPYRVINVDGQTISMWGFSPVLKNFAQNMDALEYSDPFIHSLKSLQISKDKISGIDINSGNKLELITTNERGNIKMLKKHSTEFNSAPNHVRKIYENYIQNKYAGAMIRFEYEYYWD